ncbi:unnamed protein product [Blepharisma stoltei]|uniref:OPA3-like protein n=1 Tax=Blepharisma stoltei TaxID=1481888 RepID=A0AAU9K4F7_9CILI|nr:unnamed protein product [Blepharisma stoltei]
MLPLIKVFSLTLKLFTRPITNQMKISLKTNQNHHPVFRNLLLYLGQSYHRINVKIQRKLIGMESDDYVKPLKDDKALEQGADFFGEIVAYSILLVWGSYELIKSARDNRIKENSYAETLKKINAQLEGLNNGCTSLMAEMENLKEKIAEEEAELSKIETNCLNEALNEIDNN